MFMFITPILNDFFLGEAESALQDYRRQTSLFGEIMLMYFKPKKNSGKEN